MKKNNSIYHSSCGGFDFLGLREGRTGAIEIVYDDGVKRRLVWTVKSKPNHKKLGEALSYAINQARVLPALYSEMKKRAINIEALAV